MKNIENNNHTSQPIQKKGKGSNYFFKGAGEGDFFSGNGIFDGAEKNTPFFTPNTIQPKLAIGQPGDQYEQEADAMAEKVVNQTQSVTINKKPIFESNAESSDEIQRKCEECEEEHVQKKESSTGTETGSGEESASSGLENQLNSSKGGGQPLPEETRSQMESSFGTDFSRVKVHTNQNAVQMNQDLGAHAFTHGSDIYFNQGQYDTGSKDGQQLLAHELTHVVQQGSSPKIQGHMIQCSCPDCSRERIQRKEISSSDNDVQASPEETSESSSVPSKTLSASVGVGGNNLAGDVRLIQMKLAELGMLSIFSIMREYSPSKKNDEVIPENSLKSTIQAIKDFQRSLGWGEESIDGNITPGKSTIIHLNIAAGKAKVEREKKAYEARVNESTDEDNIEKIYNSVNGDLESLAKLMVKYLVPNSQMVTQMIYYTWYFSRDTLVYHIVDLADESTLSKTGSDLIQLLYNALDTGWTVEDEYEMMDKLKPYLPQEEEVKKEESNEEEAPMVFVVIDPKAYLREPDSLSEFIEPRAENKIPKDTKVIIKETKEGNGKVEGTDGTEFGWTSLSNLRVEEHTDISKYKAEGTVDKMYGSEDMRGLRTRGGYRDDMDEARTEGKDHDELINEYLDIVDEELEEREFTEDQTNLFAEAKKVVRDSAYREKIFSTVKAKIVWTDSIIKDGEQDLNEDLIDRLNKFHKFAVYSGLISHTNIDPSSGARSREKAHSFSTEHVIKWGVDNKSGKYDTWENMLSRIKSLVDSDGKAKDMDGNVWYVQSEDEVAGDDRATFENIQAKTGNGSRAKYYRGNWNKEAAEGYGAAHKIERRFPNTHPGISNHIGGEASDIHFNYKLNEGKDPIYDAIAMIFGLVRPVGTETWHYERAGAVPFGEASCTEVNNEPDA